MDTNTGLSGNSNPFGGSNISKPVPKSGTSLSPSPDNGDIVPRDKNGCYKLDIPVLPPAVFEEADGGDSMEGIEHTGGAEIPVEEGGELAGRDKESMFLLSSFIALGVSSRYKNLFLTKETEIDASFVEMMRHNRSRHINGEPSGMNYRLLPLVFLEIKLVLLEQLLMITLEVFLLVQQNLRDSVLKLEEDNWMFEAEEEVKL
ncbi:hypothetical protein TRV_05405 [Trichophyton verrucosum HKI 0517]|uniref:Uncharacterized protein n=1 Tax=Trichophyton verrucosum (strain HKI 0517) TaxID=663202 RepID=D4DE41_TRIVH|nr:uncharacterized protein TRV_05405 [Trichophyton verrucosum HKI 0517]EFE39893.1 hypothetical protein TRV_05405 [Trichophyton verrucosum HKI 0517]